MLVIKLCKNLDKKIKKKNNSKQMWGKKKLNRNFIDMETCLARSIFKKYRSSIIHQRNTS